MNGDFMRAVLRTNPRLFRWMVQFNCSPAVALHPDHRPEDVNTPLFESLVASPRGERRLSDWLQHRRRLSPAGCWSFEEPSRRVALLDPATLQQLLLLAGATAQHPRIAALIAGPRIREIKEFLGDAVYQFAVRRAGLLRGHTQGAELNSDNLCHDIAGSGHRALLACVAGSPAELLQRLALRLPAGFDLTVADLSDDERRQTWQRLRRIIRSEFEPDVSECFN